VTFLSRGGALGATFSVTLGPGEDGTGDGTSLRFEGGLEAGLATGETDATGEVVVFGVLETAGLAAVTGAVAEEVAGGAVAEVAGAFGFGIVSALSRTFTVGGAIFLGSSLFIFCLSSV
jgi:hypothetical protein